MSEVWKSALAEIEQNISHENFTTWFTGSELVSSSDGVVTIGVPNPFKKTQLQAKFAKEIQKALEKCGVEVEQLEFQVTSTERRVRPDGIAMRPQTVVRAASGRSGLGGSSLQTGLNPKYTFDNFVVGGNNILATSVARNIVEAPGEKYNPFFLYGGPGLGKTHLVQAIGNATLARNANFKVLYAPISSFYSDFIKAVQNKKTEEFRQRFMRLDMLIVDDFQMIINKDASQKEFFDIFNMLHMANKHIIVTSDRLPDQIKSVDERLASRLTWAGAYDLQMPQFEDRCAILRSKADFKGVEIEDEAVEYIAENVQTNVRALEGELDHLLAVADIKRMTPLEVIREGYINTGSQSRNRGTVSPKQVIEKVAKFYQLTPKEMCSKSRVSHIKNARQVAMYILSKELGMSTPKIAMEVGVKDHTTVMHGIKKIEGDLKLNFTLRDQVTAIKEKIYA